MLQRTIPLAIVFIFGLLMSIQFYVPHRVSQEFYRVMLDWFNGVQAFAIVLAIGSLIMHHWRRVMRRQNTVYSATTLISLAVMGISGVFFGIERGSLADKLFWNIQVPLQSTTFSLLAFFMASAAYRAFRARTMEATLLLAAAFILMFGMTPFSTMLSPKITEFTFWILNVPNLAAQRGIIIGVGLGIIATSVKIILGIERNWLGG